MRSTKRRVVAVSLVIALLTVLSACARSDEDATTDTSAESTSGDAATGAPVDGRFGSLAEPVCGPAPSSSDASTGSTVEVGATSGANVQGVTSTAIKIGVISDVGYSGYPGLNQELFDASDVFAAWCNSLGGINGHEIQIDKLDAKLTEYKGAISQACAQDFALVGGGGVFDSTGQADRLACLLPDFPGYVVSAEARGSDFSVQATNGGSNTAVSFGLANYLDETYPEASDAVGYITANVNTTIINKQQYQEAGATLGWNTVYDDQYNAVGEPTWLPFAQSIKDKGTRGLYFVGSAVNLAKLLGALAQIDYKLDWVAGPSNIYDPALIAESGDSLDVNNVYINDATTPFLATEVPAIPQYEALFDEYLPNGLKTASLGLNSFAAWLLFAQSAKACGVNLTRLCVYNQAIATTSFDGAGLSGQADPSTPEVPTACFVPVVASAKGFAMIAWNANEGPYNCDPKNVIPLTGSYGSSVKFAEGQSLADLD